MNESGIESIPSGEPFASLSMLRRQHSVMLSQRGGESGGKNPTLTTEEILALLGRVKATGRILADPDSRDAAQSVLDYWSAVLLTSRPELSDKLGALFPDDCDSTAAMDESVTGRPMGGEEPSLEEDARQFTSQLNHDESETLRRLLPKLVRFSVGTDEFYLHAMPVADAAGQDPEEQKLLKQMLAKGLIRLEGKGPSASYVLTDISLIKSWLELREICSQRRTFRGQARRWQNAARAKSLLLDSGPQLATASRYRDMLEYETAYLDFSRSEADGKNRRAKWALTAWLVIVSVLAVACVGTAVYLFDSNNKLKIALEEIKKANEEKAKATDAVASTRYELAQVKTASEAALGEILYEVVEAKKEISGVPAMSGETSKKLDDIVAVIKNAETLPGPTSTTSPQLPRTPKAADARWSAHPNLSQTASEATSVDGWQSGKVHVFDIDRDPRIKPTDTLAIILRWSEADALTPQVFKRGIERGPKPLVVQLDASSLFLAARWDYKITPRRWLLQNKIEVRNPRTGKAVAAQPVDWGPSAKDGHLMDISPGLAKALGLSQDEIAEIKVSP